MNNFTTDVLYNKKLSPFFFELSFKWDKTAEIPIPGQFITIIPSRTTDPLLRRPFAISSFNKKNHSASVIIQIRGKGTELLSLLETGDKTNVLGPLGTGFSLCGKEKLPILVAGGIGLGPMLYLREEFLRHKITPLFISGFRDKNRIISSVPQQSANESVICTDDGSEGFKGSVADYLKTVPVHKMNTSCIYACGPVPMMKACHEIALENNIPCYVSMEEIMGCAVGACMGCVIPKADSERGKYVRACKDGPVFESRILKWT